MYKNINYSKGQSPHLNQTFSAPPCSQSNYKPLQFQSRNMSLSRPLLHYGLKPLFASWYASVGAEVAARTRVSVVGGLYLQARQIRSTTVSYFSVRDEI